MPLRIIIIGSGVARLASAAILGHSAEVKIIERGSTARIAGGQGISLVPNAAKILDSLGWDRKLVKTIRTDDPKKWGDNWTVQSRADFRNELIRLATEDGPGKAPTVLFETKVADTERGTVTLGDRQQISLDVIIGESSRQNKQASKEARNAIDWFYEVVQDETFDPVTFQLTLAVVAIHSTSDMLVQALHGICSHPQLIDELRQEIESVFTAKGFKRSSINNLRLMDSVFKESQRLKPLALGEFRSRSILVTNALLTMMLVAIQRVATEEIKLSDGLLIPKGSTIVTPGYGMWDSSVYLSADMFDGHRSLRSREQPEEQRSAQLVTTASTTSDLVTENMLAQDIFCGDGRQHCSRTPAV